MKKLSCVLLFSLSIPLIAGEDKSVACESKRPQQAILFTENLGQIYDQHHKSRPDVLFTGEMFGMDFHLRKHGISYQLTRVESWKTETERGKEVKLPTSETVYRVDLDWRGCNATAQIITEDNRPGTSNYFRPVCPNGVYGVRSYGGVTYQAIYPGIDLHYYSKNGNLKYDYLLAAGADYKQIKIDVSGANSISVHRDGHLEILTPLGSISENQPLVVQGGKVLRSSWILQNTTLTFDIEGLDPGLPFVIDPAVRVWGTYYATGLDEKAAGSCTDASGNVYMVGEAAGNGLATSGAHQVLKNSGRDAFLVKFNAAGVRLWGTYYGAIQSAGGPATRGYGVCTDAARNVFMSGNAPASVSTEIATSGSHQSTIGGQLYDAFLVKFDSSGVRQWGTYYGGDGTEVGNSCTTDASGNVYLVGGTTSSVNMATPGAFLSNLVGSGGAFIAKFTAAGVRLWATYYGSSCGANSCVVDGVGDLVVAGQGQSSGMVNMATPGSHQPSPGGDGELWLAKFRPNGTMIWGTYYGGPGAEAGGACAVDCHSNIYLAGDAPLNSASSTSALTTSGAFQSTYAGGYRDAFLAKFNSAGVRQWGTLYGTDLHDNQYGCAVDVEGNVYIAGYLFGGYASSGNALATAGAHQTVMPTTATCYLAKFSDQGQRLWTTYYGYDGNVDSGGASACATYRDGSVYMVGWVLHPQAPITTNYIATPGSHQPLPGNSSPQSGYYYDAFLVRFHESVNTQTAAVTITSTHSLLCIGQSATLTASGANNYSWTPAGSGTQVVISPTVSTNYMVTGTGVCAVAYYTQSVVPVPVLTVTGNAAEICSGQSVTLTAAGAANYVWQPTGLGSSITVTPTVSSTYTVTGTNNNGCTGTATITQLVNPCVGLAEQSMTGEPVYYPNPVTDHITIHYAKALSIRIYNGSGMLVLSAESDGGKRDLDVSRLANGIYLLFAIEGERTFVKKIIRE